MILRHSREPIDGQPIENTFEAIDDKSGALMGSCWLKCESNPNMFPSRPYQIKLNLSGDGGRDALLGAALARARVLCSQSGVPSRIYVRCPEDDAELLNELGVFGFKDNDGLVKMKYELPIETSRRLPAGCALVVDDLSDELEQNYFLERYNGFFLKDHGSEWMSAFISRENFTRILVVAPTGMAGEIVFWTESGTGVIGFIDTPKRWRRMGIATFLIEQALKKLEMLGIGAVECGVRVRIPGILRLLEGVGFVQEELLMRYPGIDVG